VTVFISSTPDPSSQEEGNRLVEAPSSQEEGNTYAKICCHDC